MPATGFELIAEPSPEPAPAPKAPAARPGRKSKLDDHLDKVGVLPDKEVAELVGVTPENVRAYRNRRGIPAGWRGAQKPKAAKKPKATKTAKTAKASRPPRRGKLTPFMDQLGVTPDARIAEMAGTSPANVRAFRLRHEIPARWRGEGEPLPTEPVAPVLALAPAPAPSTAKATRKPRTGKLTPYLEEIGILSDAVIADKAETTAQNVRAFRIRHGIPARWRGEGEPLANEEAILVLHAGPQALEELTPVVEAAPATEPALELVDELPPEADDVEAPLAEVGEGTAMVLKGYKVKVVAGDEKATFVVVGKDIVEAAKNAVAALGERSSGGEVVAVKFLAEILGR